MNGINEEAIRRVANREEGISVAAGSPNLESFLNRVERQRVASSETISAFPAILGLFFRMVRRDRCFSLDQFAEQIETNPIDLILIEEGRKTPEPHTITKLAEMLEVSAVRLMQLAGHIRVLDSDVAQAAYVFESRTHSKPLEPMEKEALQDFAKALAS